MAIFPSSFAFAVIPSPTTPASANTTFAPSSKKVPATVLPKAESVNPASYFA